MPTGFRNKHMHVKGKFFLHQKHSYFKQGGKIEDDKLILVHSEEGNGPCHLRNLTKDREPRQPPSTYIDVFSKTN